MMILEQVADLPSSPLCKTYGPWVKVLPMSAPWICRLRDAWEVLQGRAEAVRQMTVDDLSANPDLIPGQNGGLMATGQAQGQQ